MSDLKPILAKLTGPQRIALRWLLRQGEGLDCFLWHERVRPWPTMENLVKKGLVETLDWEYYSSEEQGYVRRLTPLGIEVAEALEVAA